MISLIASMAKNRVIGLNGKIPWSLPADMRHFKNTTLGNIVVMGRKTFESIGKPLVRRSNFVLSSNEELIIPGCTVINNIFEFILSNKFNNRDIIGIGGESIYKLLLPYADMLYLTYLDAEVEGDTFFPEFNEVDWERIGGFSHGVDESHGYSFEIKIFKRKYCCKGHSLEEFLMYSIKTYGKDSAPTKYLESKMERKVERDILHDTALMVGLLGMIQEFDLKHRRTSNENDAN